MAYLSKKVDLVASGWPPCLKLLVVTTLVVKDADKLTFGLELLITTPHATKRMLKQPLGKWMTNTPLTHYQGLLLYALQVLFLVPTSLNLATLLPNPELESPLYEILSELTTVL